MNILLTGDRGFIGSHLKDRLKELGHTIVFHETNEFDYIIHCASPSNPETFVTNPKKVIEANVVLTALLLEKARKEDVPFLFISTTGVCHEADYRETKSCYLASKKLGELMCLSSKKTVVRLPIVYGKGMKHGVVYDFANNIKNKEPISLYSPNQIRNFVYIDDAVEGIIKVMEKGIPSEAYNICPKGISILNLACKLADEFDLTINMTVRENDIRNEFKDTTVPDNMDMEYIDVIEGFKRICE